MLQAAPKSVSPLPYSALLSRASQELSPVKIRESIAELVGQNRLDEADLLSHEALVRFPQSEDILVIRALVAQVRHDWSAASDALESGQVVSGVGGQYNFVAMAHALPDARLIMMLRATHDNKDGLKSSIVWNYGHVTIPRHLRDIMITEYGVADLRGQSDGEVVKRLIAIADSRFQDDLVKEAKAHGKLEADYVLPERYRSNLPEVLEKNLHPWTEAGLLPDFPFGTDLTEDELRMVRAMKKIKHASEHPAELLTMAIKSLWEGKEAPQAYLERLGLDDAHSIKDLLMRRLFAGNL